ncbi:MAG: glucuronate isomerase [Bacteroidota bacterium]
METFLDKDFLLTNSSAQRLYHEFAAKMPIIDYHCHLSPTDIAANRQFRNLTEVWLEGDHYKWRAMRTHGIAERFCTGDADPEQKFAKWAETVPYTVRNPLYHWTHLELKRYFDRSEILSPQTARDIYGHCGEQLQEPEFRVWGLLAKMRVEVVCTTDDPLDDLQAHQSLAHTDCKTKVIPAFRPDKFLRVDDPIFFNQYLDQLGELTYSDLAHYIDLINALQQRIDYFHQAGCRLSDHGLETIYAADFSDTAVNAIFHKIRLGNQLSPEEIAVFRSSLLYHLCQMYHAKGWTQQFHLGALRNNNSRMLRTLGPDTGFDSIGDWNQAPTLAKFLDRLDTNDQLAQTILYNLNPRDNEVMATMVGNFNDGSVAGKIQWGSGWWFLDQKDGMEKQLNCLSNMGSLAHFVGMLTDSRSFLSYPRHEYFRRILCNLIGQDIEKGELPRDFAWLGKLVEDICYNNARSYFGFYENESELQLN